MLACIVYLIRLLGSSWGVDITVSIVHSTVNRRLSEVLSGVTKKEKVIEHHEKPSIHWQSS